jgi:sugar/nucleoside kinase (ribokinase family)
VSLDAERFTQRREELFRLTDILIVAQRFGQEVTGRSAVAEILDGLHRLGPRVVGLTRGECGSVLSVNGRRTEAPGFSVDVVDTTGAGDVFHGAIVYGVLQEWEASHILLFANAVSALKCTRLGGRTGIPSVDEVNAFLRARGVEIPAPGLGKESPR